MDTPAETPVSELADRAVELMKQGGRLWLVFGPGFPLESQHYSGDVTKELAARIADRNMAQALAVERATDLIKGLCDNDEWNRGLHEALSVVRTLADPSGVEALAALRVERDRFEAALGRACPVGGTTYLVERAEKAEAERDDALARLATLASAQGGNGEPEAVRPIWHVALRGGGTEGFITDNARDADWTSTGRPQMSMRPAIGDDMREFLENENEVLPRKYALLFDSEEEAEAAAAKLTTG